MSIPDLRAAVYERCKGFCEKCGGQLGSNWALHHRKLRSQGGRNEPENVLALHHECHNGMTSSVHHQPASSDSLGYIVLQSENPLLKPLLLYGERGWWVTLAPDSTYTKGIYCLECNTRYDYPVHARDCAMKDKLSIV